MLTPSQRDCLTVVLVSPRNPLNIGAAARAMANFGFGQLAVVAPYEEHWREAKSAVGAENLLQEARRSQCLAEAVADCTLVIGTASLTRRKPEHPVVPLPDLPPIIRAEIARGGRVALVFGSEKRGLARDDLSLCHLLVEIPTDPPQPSMNLGQAVAVCLYELAARAFAAGNQFDQLDRLDRPEPAKATISEPEPAAASGTLDLLASLIEQTMQAAHYSPAAMREANRRDLRLMLRRLALNRRDTRRVLGLFRRILWRLQHGAHRN